MGESSLLRCISVRHLFPLLPRFGSDMATSDVLDGGMVTLAIYTLNFFHPGRLLSGGEDVSNQFLGVETREMRAKFSPDASSSNIV